jgi:hypothetical protein
MEAVVRLKGPRRMSGNCPDPEFLAAYLGGGLTSSERELVEEHLLDCCRCRDVVSLFIESEDSVVQPSNTDPP